MIISACALLEQNPYIFNLGWYSPYNHDQSPYIFSLGGNSPYNHDQRLHIQFGFKYSL
jgi:hypothetical protein